MATKQALISSFLIALLLCHSSATTLSQSPAKAPPQAPAEAPVKPAHPPSSPAATDSAPPLSDVPIVQAPPHKGRSRIPTDVTQILEKVGGFSVFIRLLKSTEVLTQVENQLSASNSLTILAPTNDAFASTLKPGTLNTLTDQQKIHLMQYHVLPTFISLDKFQTISNPVSTQAASSYDYPMDITTEGNWVNISTGIVNASITATVFADDQLAIYRVDKVLLPLGVFAPRPKLPAPAPSPTAKAKSSTTSSSSSTLDSADDDTKAASGASSVTRTLSTGVSIGLAMAVAILVLE
ncbi:hypothetical protein L484_014385 [Morus notabilis]|uniref:FAS1 domain-containing protein n=1 Tax=Morus notabilis TaxID=981085 RepID=W9RVW5_9ROSA|nr:fasciclin-like arabinogalactan protein 12 [Morus notabilis]EXB98543.1 hypothetical protein L484_014385 [Morus notabilis]